MLDALQVDSLVVEMNEQKQYIDMIRNVMTGNVSVDSTDTAYSLLTQENAKIDLEKSSGETAFCAEFEEAERYTVTIDNDRQTDINYLMHRPARGIINDKFDEKNRFFGVSMNMGDRSNVYSTLDGVVVFSGFNASDNLFVVQIQHVDDLISVYKIKQPFLKRVGDNVNAGEILATLNSGTEPKLIFELWRKGKPVNPESYIMF